MNEEKTPRQQETAKQNKVLTTVVNVILVIAIVFGIICAFSAFQAKTGSGAPSILGMHLHPIQSDSMEPFFYKGDLVISAKVKDPDKLEAGDVITFWTIIGGQRVLNTHRIVGIKDYDSYLSFVTRGDNPKITDDDRMEVHQNEIVGKYLFTIPKLGAFIDYLQTSQGFLLVIVLPVALFFIWQLIQFFRSLFAYQAEKIRLQYQGQIPTQPANTEANQTGAGDSAPSQEKKE